MDSNFIRALDGIFRRTDPISPPKRKPAPEAATPGLPNDPIHRHKWFAQFAANEVMPLLGEVAERANRHGASATCRLGEENGHLAAELVIVPRRLPKGAKPPRLTLYAAEGDRPLMVEYTGTFPHVGATGGFGAEIDFDSIYPGQLQEHILEFVALATG